MGWVGRSREWLLAGHGVSFWSDENVPEVDNGSCEGTRNHQIVYFEVVKMVNFMVRNFISI